MELSDKIGHNQTNETELMYFAPRTPPDPDRFLLVVNESIFAG